MAKGIKAGFWCICAPSADLHAELHRKKKVKEEKLRLETENREESFLLRSPQFVYLGWEVGS